MPVQQVRRLNTIKIAKSKIMIGRKYELSFLQQGLAGTGSLRCALINGEEGMGKTTLLERFFNHLIANGKHLLISANGKECNACDDLLSQFTRNLLCSESLEANGLLNQFARKIGGQLLLQANPREPKVNGKNSTSDVFVEELSSLIINSFPKDEKVIPIIIIEDLDNLSNQSLEWLTGEFNHALRKSPQFKNCRFVFSSREKIGFFKDFWAKFGFENPVDLPLKPFTASQIYELAEKHEFKNFSAEDLAEVSRGNPALALKYLQNGFIMKNKNKEMDNTKEIERVDLSNLSEKELEYLLYASYPAKINRYNLEHFCSPKLAAFTYNWLKRQPRFCEHFSGGDLVLNQSAKQQMRAFHKEQEPEQAEKLTTLASVLDAFYDKFPDTENHWIPVNLQAFNSFSKSLCRKVFDEYEFERIVNFLPDYDHILDKRGKNFCLTEETRQLVKRYMELSGTEIKPGLIESVQAVWESDQIEFQKRKAKIDSEQTDLNSEISDIQSQVTHFQNLKKNIEDSFRNPKKSKPKRVITFNISFVLVVFGLIVVGASLLSDMLGTYHAACGLAVTIFGFFWPNVEIQKVNSDGSLSTPNLAIETQQRSLDHRINGLLGRANSIALNLENLSKEAMELDQGSAEPYLPES